MMSFEPFRKAHCSQPTARSKKNVDKVCCLLTLKIKHYEKTTFNNIASDIEYVMFLTAEKGISCHDRNYRVGQFGQCLERRCDL